MMSEPELHTAFKEILEVYEPGENPRVHVGDKTNTLDGVTWHLRKSDAVMPDDVCDMLDGLPRGSTYAQGVRHMKEAQRDGVAL